MNKKNRIWIKVTHDKYELPVLMATSVKELSRMTGDSEAAIRQQVLCWQHGKLKHPSYVAVDD